MDFPQLLGPSYTPLSMKAECQRAMNVYLERIESGAGRGPVAMYRQYGLSVWSAIPAAAGKMENRGFLLDPTNDHLFTVQGDTVYDFNSAGTLNGAGVSPVAGTGLVEMDESRDSLFIVAGGVLYRVFGGALTTPATPFVPITVGVISGLVVSIEEGTNRFYWSTDDGATWPALNFQTAEAYPNSLINLVIDHQELWLFGNRRTQVFVVGSDPDAPFEAVQAGVIEMGLAARRAVAQLDNSIFWLGKNKNGDVMVFRANGYTPLRVSDHAVENAMRSYGFHDDASMHPFQLNGRSCIRLTFPSARSGLGATWEYDVNMNHWTEVGSWNWRYGYFERHRGNAYVSAFEKIIVGDFANGYLYELSPDNYTDFGYPLRFERRAPHLTRENLEIQYKRFEVVCQIGVGLVTPYWLNSYSMNRPDFVTALAAAVAGGGVTAAQALVLQDIYDQVPYIPLNPYPAPDVMDDLGFFAWGTTSMLSDGTTVGEVPVIQMRYSNTGAETWTEYSPRSLGRTSDFTQRLYWDFLGMGRDRVWELASDAPVKIAIVGGSFKAEVCDR